MKHYDIYLPEKIPETTGLDEYEDGRPLYRLEDDFIIYIDGSLNVIKKGFVFDYASVPKFLWCLFPPYHPDYAAAALMHDLLYAAEIFSRETNDSIFYSIMRAAGNSKRNSKIMYDAVSVFGGFTYRRHTAASVMKWRYLHGIHSTLRPIIPDYSPDIL